MISSARTAPAYEHRKRATGGLRAQLRYELLDLGAAPDWSTLEVTSPATTVDAIGQTWFEYQVYVQSRVPFDPDRGP